MSKVLGRKLFKKQSARGKGITSMLEDFPQGFAEGGEVSPRDGMTAEERKRLATEMLSRAREEGYTFIEEGERPSLTRQAAVGAAPAMGPDPRAAQQLAMMQQMGMMPPRFQQGGLNDLTMGGGMGNPFEPPPMMTEMPVTNPPYVPATPFGRTLLSPFLSRSVTPKGMEAVEREQERMRVEQETERAKEATPVPGMFSVATEEEVAAAKKAREEAIAAAKGPTPELPDREMMRERSRALGLGSLPREEVPSPAREETPSPPQEPPKRGEGEETKGGGITLPAVSKEDLLLPGIQARREELKAEREQSKWLALMQAGLAMAAGRSPSAISNIGAGGIAGLQALRESQRDIRREERDLMSDEMKLTLAREQAAAERAYREAQLGLSQKELAARGLERKEATAARTSAQATTAARETGNLLRLTVQNIDTRLSDLEKKAPLAIDPQARAVIDSEILSLRRERADALEQYKSVLSQLGVTFPAPQQGANAFPGFSAKPVAPPK